MTKDPTISAFWWRVMSIIVAILVALWATGYLSIGSMKNMSGHGYVLLQFYQTSVAPWQAYEGNEIIIEASYFTNRHQETDDTPDITASGQRVREGIVANNCYEFGTKIEIDGRQYEVQDRMNRRYSCEHVDIFTFDYQEAIQKGREIKIVKLLD